MFAHKPLLRKAAYGMLALVVACLFALSLVNQPWAVMPAQAGVVPTPAVSNPMSTDNARAPVYFWTAEAITSSGGSNSTNLQNYELLDTMFVIDAGTLNTLTIKPQWSNDDTNWSDGADMLTNVIADVTTMTQQINFGRYTRLYATVQNTYPVTITAISVAK